jgi:hypothetical protein
MKVARQFLLPGMCPRKDRPGGQVVIGSEEMFYPLSGERASRPTQTVPYGTDLLLNPFQAINCLATIIPSLRDKSTS